MLLPKIAAAAAYDMFNQPCVAYGWSAQQSSSHIFSIYVNNAV